MKKVKWVIVLFVIAALISVVYMMSQNAKYHKLTTQDEVEMLSRDEANKNRELERLARDKEDLKFAEESAKEQALWLKRTRVEMRDAIVNGRFLIAPLGITLDPSSLPEGTAYSYYWNTSEKAYVQMEVGEYDTGGDDNCFGLIEVLKDLNDTDEDNRYPLKWMTELALNKNVVKKLDEKDFALYVKPQSPCDAMGLHLDAKEGYIFDSVGEKISGLGAQIERAIQTAEYVK